MVQNKLSSGLYIAIASYVICKYTSYLCKYPNNGIVRFNELISKLLIVLIEYLTALLET